MDQCSCLRWSFYIFKEVKINEKEVVVYVLVFVLTAAMCGCGQTAKTEEGYSVKASTGTYIGHDNDGITEFLEFHMLNLLKNGKLLKN